jgi:NADH-quinone oxidoreductase subunit J
VSVYSIIFYFFSVMLILSALKVVTTKNAVTSILCLVLCFFCSSVLWMMLHAEFLSLVLIFLYVGAVMILFMFVLMMIDFRSAFNQQSRGLYSVLGLIFLVIFSAIISLALISQHLPKMKAFADHASVLSNTASLGYLLYTQHLYAFEITGAILLVSIVAAISLVHVGPRPNSKQQDMASQHAVTKKDRLKIIKMEGES